MSQHRILSLFAACCSLVGPGLGVSQAETSDRLPTIRVTGEGSVQVVPDLANVTVGVESETATAADALSLNNKEMESLLSVLGELGVAKKDIQTTGLNVSPQYRRDPSRKGPPEVVAYRVTNTVAVKVRSIPGLGKALDAMVKAGANRVQGIRFSVSDPGDRMDDARRAAMKDARHKAEVLAREVEADVGPAIEINESAPSVPRPFAQGFRMTAADSAAVPIAAGEQTLTANVSVTFVLEPAAGK